MLSGETVQAVETVFLLLLVFVAGFALLARWLKVAYPIVLVVAGLLVSLVPHVPRIPLNSNLIFLIFLPPLLFSSAWHTSWRELQRNGVSIGLLAIGLVAFTVWGVAEFSDHFVTALDWKAGFVLGAVVAATDAIAATSIAKSLGLPRRISDILEGESLMNDATGLLALEFGIKILIDGETPTFGAGLLRLVYLIVVGSGIGLGIGWVVSRVSLLIDDGPVEMVISVIVPYAAYLAGDAAKASGVFAVVACALYMSRQSATFFSPRVRIQVNGAWDALTFMLNGVVFILIGLQLPFVLAAIRGAYGWGTLVKYGLAFSAVLIVLRMVWVYPASWLAWWFERCVLKRTGKKPRSAVVFVIGWTGMRGVLALAAALSLPEVMGGREAATRNLIVFLAFSVILVTLVLQGLTLPPLIRWLGLAKAVGVDEEEIAARRTILGSAIQHLEGLQGDGGEQYAHVYDDLLHRYRHRLAAISAGGGDEDGMDATTYARLREIAEGAVRAEREAMIRLREEGRIGDDTLRTMERELDLTESRYQGRLE